MSHFSEAFRAHVDMPSASENELEERKRRKKGRICACGRERGGQEGRYSCVRARE